MGLSYYRVLGFVEFLSGQEWKGMEMKYGERDQWQDHKYRHSGRKWSSLKEEKEAAKRIWAESLDYIGKLGELDTTNCGTYSPCIPSSEYLP